MSDNDNSRLIFNSKEYELPDQFANPIDEIFQIFFKYLVDGEEPEIHLDNIYELKQLANEFQISELIAKVNEKFKKWRELEKTLDQQSTSSNAESPQSINITQAIQQIYQIFDEMKNRIQELGEQVRLLKIENESQNKELECQFKNDMETYFDQQIEQIKESNENKEKEIYSNLQNIKDEIESKY